MTDEFARTEDDHLEDARIRLMAAALPNVAFDGWSHVTLQAAIVESGVDPDLARLAFPRGGIDLALGFHRQMDRILEGALPQSELDAMRIRDRITYCVRKRIELVSAEREAVRRAAALFALPHNAPEGARAIWQTADTIWRMCGDDSRDYNYYSKRAILSSVYSSTLLYWLGDDDPRGTNTWEFLDRRIENVMQFEKFKAKAKENPMARAMMAIPNAFLGMVRAPGTR